MRIIIDGCDKSGKTTLIEGLKNELPNLIGLKLLTKPKDGTEQSRQYVKMMYAKMAELTRDQGLNFLFDRWYPSEMAYSFKRGYNAIQDGWFWKFEQEIRKTPHLYILLEADKKLIAQRFKSDGETFAKPEDIDRIQKRYRKHFDRCQLNKMVIDPTDRLPEAIQEIINAIKIATSVQTYNFTEQAPTHVKPLADEDDDPVTEEERKIQDAAIEKEKAAKEAK